MPPAAWGLRPIYAVDSRKIRGRPLIVTADARTPQRAWGRGGEGRMGRLGWAKAMCAGFSGGDPRKAPRTVGPVLWEGRQNETDGRLYF